jgi:hypothetical protein
MMQAHRLLRHWFPVAAFAIFGAIAETSLRLASVAGLPLDTTISVIREGIGSANVRRYMVDSEEGRVPAYSILSRPTRREL